jgi:hypothetical protein
MSTFKTTLVVGILLAQFLAAVDIGCAQTARTLRERIPKPDPTKYQSVRDGVDWKNPYLIVRPDGVVILGMTPAAQTITVESVPAVLQKLPDAAWPYGLIVAVQDVGIVGGITDTPRIDANRTKLLKLLKELDVAVDRWPAV